MTALPVNTERVVSAGPMLGGRYRLIRLLATGGMGQVWEASDTVLGRPVAVKLLKREYTSQPAVLARFAAEARHSASLSHPNIARVHDYACETDGDHVQAYLVMELLDGEPLSERLRRQPVPPHAFTAHVLAESAIALHAAHEAGVVHRDVKPGNIMITGEGQVKLTDFGIARAEGAAALTNPGEAVGTPKYMSPEQAQGRTATPASDLYSLGVVGHEMLTGRAPFADGPPAAIALAHVRSAPPPLPDDVPPALRDVIVAAMAKDPARRPHDALEFARAVREAVPWPGGPGAADTTTRMAATDRTQVMDVAPAAPPPATAVERRSRRHRPGALVAIFLAVLLLAVAGALAVRHRSTTGDPVRTVPVSSADLLGQPVDQVALWLSAQGLTVHQQLAASATTPPGMVVSIDPDGAVPVGSTVTLTVAAGATTVVPAAPTTAAAPAANGHGNGKSKKKK